MRTLLSIFRPTRPSLAVSCLCALIALLSLPLSAAAGDPADATTPLAARDSTLLASSPMPPDPSPVAGQGAVAPSASQSPPPWTVSLELDALFWTRAGGVKQTLVERVPGSVPFTAVQFTPGATALTSADLQNNFAPGAKATILIQTDSGFGLDLSSFHIAWASSRTLGPDSPSDWLVMRAPGDFFQTQDFTYQAMAWDSSTRLYNAEANTRWALCQRLTLLVGFRWLHLADSLKGSLPPMDQKQPLWKFNPNNTLADVARLENLPGPPYTGWLPPFWETTTSNYLYGLQLGVEGKLLEYGRFSLTGLAKAGVSLNSAKESTNVSIFKTVQPSRSSATRPAFVGEAGLQGSLQLTRGLALKAGYDALWLSGVALAPGQIKETYTTSPNIVHALGMHTSASVLFHGATVGLAYTF